MPAAGDAHLPGGQSAPSALRPAPASRSTPLPATFALDEDHATRHLEGGAVLVGGSPLRLFRLSTRARAVLARWRSGRLLGPDRSAGLLARRLVSAGAFVPRPTAAGYRARDVTVVVPVRDRSSALDRLLGALGGLSCVVVDDASLDAPAVARIAARHGARLVALTSNLGPAGARNAGLAQVGTPLVAFVDSDCEPTEDWIEPLLGHFDDPVVAAVAPRVRPVPDTPRRAFARYETMRSQLDLGGRPATVRSRGTVPYVPSAALVVRTDAVTGPTLYDPTLRGGEDVDLVWRLTAAGWSVRYDPTSTVAHHGAATLRTFLVRQSFYGTTAAPLARRHRDAVRPAEFSVWSLAAWILLLRGRPLAALTAVAAPVVMLAQRLSTLVRDPVAVATRLVTAATLRSARRSWGGLVRVWSPALLAGLLFARTRRFAALALVLPALGTWASRRHALDPVRFVALHVADDAAYGTGVWVGCIREGTLEPLVPRVSFRSSETT